MASPAFAALSPVVHGDTWDGITVSFSSDGSAFASPLESVEMTFSDSLGVDGLALTSASGITIDDADAWTITVDAREMTLAAGVWQWAIKTTDEAGISKTRLAGTLPVLPEP